MIKDPHLFFIIPNPIVWLICQWPVPVSCLVLVTCVYMSQSLCWSFLVIVGISCWFVCDHCRWFSLCIVSAPVYSRLTPPPPCFCFDPFTVPFALCACEFGFKNDLYAKPKKISHSDTIPMVCLGLFDREIIILHVIYSALIFLLCNALPCPITCELKCIVTSSLYTLHFTYATLVKTQTCV